MLHDAAAIPGTRRIYIGVMADNDPSRHAIEKLGFVYQYSFFQRTRPTEQRAGPSHRTPPTRRLAPETFWE